MSKHLSAGVAAVGLLSGVALAQTYPLAPPPPPGISVAPVAPLAPAASPSTSTTSTTVAPPSVGVPGSTTTTTTVSPTTDHTTTITKGVDANGNEITKKDTYREGIAGSSESQKTTVTDPDGATTTTRSKSTTKQE
jgi:hypothetical protein